MKENVRKIIGIIIAYIYLLVGYSYIIYYVSYTIRITCKPLGWAMMLAIALMFFHCLCYYKSHFIKKNFIQEIACYRRGSIVSIHIDFGME
mgnify:CR=1 FL=1